MPNLVVRKFSVLKMFLVEYLFIAFNWKMDFMISGAIPFTNSYISIATNCWFPTCIVMVLSLFSNSSKVDTVSLKTMRRGLSCILFIRLFRVLLQKNPEKWTVTKLRIYERFNDSSFLMDCHKPCFSI